MQSQTNVTERYGTKYCYLILNYDYNDIERTGDTKQVIRRVVVVATIAIVWKSHYYTYWVQNNNNNNDDDDNRTVQTVIRIFLSGSEQ